MERIGIFGGSFNPPHIGHIQAALQAKESLRLDRLLLIPAGQAPHKDLPSGSPTAQQRLDMLRLASAGLPGVEVSDLELRREGPSYTWETAEELARMYPDAERILLMGTDMFTSFHTWRNPERILSCMSLGVLYRGYRGEREAIAEQKKALEALGARVEAAQNDVLTVSSTDLRRMLVFGCAKPFLHPDVKAYIRENGLYGTARDYRQMPMEELEQAVISLLKPSRVAHVLGCRDTAVELAKHWGADVTHAARAGILHDITKALDGPLQLTLCREYGTILDEFSTRYPKTLHALTGSLVAERIFGEAPEVVEAICCHTTGKAEMNLLEKILYVADYMEPCRDFPGVERLRALAFSDMDAALRLGLEMTLEHLAGQGAEVSPQTRDTLQWLNK